LEDLLAQTIADRLEIIVIDSASPENEGRIVREFQQHHGNVKYIRTPERETIYAAWNRGIKIARGKYITNANTDDRHRRDAFEQMAAVLDAQPDVALVYADVIKTATANETFEHCTPTGMFPGATGTGGRFWKRLFYGPAAHVAAASP
jgi:glycosyltransferase involved in cell wall biosynthesis